MQDLYTSKGWINPNVIIDNPCPFVLVIGGRGIGKTYGVLSEVYKRRTPFLYMRRTQIQLDSVTVPALSPFNQINKDMGVNVCCEKIGKNTIGFYDGKIQEDGTITPEGSVLGVGIALSTFASIRGMSAEKYEVLIFDEVIPERHERPIKEEELAFANALESLNRNRELLGRPPLKVILLSNSNTINSRIIAALGCTNELEKMRRKNQSYKELNGDIAIIRYIDSPISERKKNTALYRVIQNNDFQKMSLDNDFAASDFEQVINKPLKEFNPVVSVGNMTVYKHKTNREYYIISGVKSSVRFSTLPIDIKAFKTQYPHLYGAYIHKRLYFQNAQTKIEFERVWGL